MANSKREYTRVLGIALVLTLITTIYLLPSIAAAQKTINLKFAYWMPTKHTLHRVFVNYAKEVEFLTKGKVKITLYPGGALGKPREQWDMALGGIADLSFFMPGYTAGRFPRSTIFDLPLIGGGSAAVNTALGQGIYEDYIAPDYKDAKIVIFFVCEPFTIHTSKKKITRLEDIRGLKFRTSGAIQSATVKQLGGSPVTMPITEVYTSLEKGVIDGVVTAFTAMVSFRLYDVSKYSILAGLTATPMAVAMNMKTWNSLPPDVKEVFDKLRMRYAFECAVEYDKDRVKAIKRGRSLGKEIYPLSSAELQRWESKVRGIYDDWLADMKAKGIPGDEMLGALRQLKGK
ncbi:MAG: TRAP transporter substrate-binding protein [Deltaproteobacteria bacterium]|nr:TRAP transporter substrate-binding protein [Deltaproteobacteria bacterium]